MRRSAVPASFLLIAALLTVASAAPAGASGSGTAAAAAAGPTARADFNHDGISDMAVGAPGEGVGATSAAGGVNVIYGSPTGLGPTKNQFFTQASPGIPTDPAAGGEFGVALAAGDFNGDRFSDLAIGASGAPVDGIDGAGLVIVLYGTRSGLTTSGAQLFDQNTEQVRDTAEADDGFGGALAAGNFGKGSQDDLAIAAGLESVGAVDGAGVVHVLYGSLVGLSANGNQLWSQATPGVPGDGPEANDRLGGDQAGQADLVAADFGKDGHSDLAIGDAQEDVGAITDAGAMMILYGTNGGLTAAGSLFLTQDTPGVADSPEETDRFGFSGAAGNFGKDRHADLAIGVGGEDLGSKTDCGSVEVLYGSASGLTTAASQFWNQDRPNVKDQCETKGTADNGDVFGFSLAAANFGKTSQADLAIGVPGEDIGPIVDGGAVQILYGTATGLSAAGNQFFSQNTPGVKETSEGETSAGDMFADFFGLGLAAANFGKSRHADLAIGSPGEDLAGNSAINAGVAQVLYGSPGGLVVAGNQLWSQDSPNIKDQSEAGDLFGVGFATGPGASGGGASAAKAIGG